MNNNKILIHNNIYKYSENNNKIIYLKYYYHLCDKCLIKYILIYNIIMKIIYPSTN